jgi:hypothetical protein
MTINFCGVQVHRTEGEVGGLIMLRQPEHYLLNCVLRPEISGEVQP